MFGFLKNLRGKPSEEKPAAPTPPRPAPPAPSPVTVAPPPAAVLPQVDAAPVEIVPLSAKAILKALPAELKEKINRAPSDTVMAGVPLSVITSQLPKGAVKISFGQLRSCMPAGVLVDGADSDSTIVDLPLPEILARLKPGQLPKRQPQKRMEAPEEIAPIFGNRGEGLRAPAAASPAPPAPPPPAPVVPAPSPAPAAVSSPEPAPITMAPIAAERPATPKADPPSLIESKPIGPAEATCVRVPIKDLISAGSADLKEALSPLESGVLDLPAGELEQGLKKGKVVVQWGQMRQWLRGVSGAGLDRSPETQFELPLKVLAPLFLAAKKPAVSQKKYVVAENIPNLFSSQGGLNPPPATPAAAAAPVPSVPPAAPVAIAPAAPAPAAPAKSGPAEYGEIFGEPGKRDWTPREIVDKIANLSGVAGALLATSDGLQVAAHLSSELNAETVAAFVPQMFSRIVQYTRELKLGEPPHITLMIENVPLQMFKAGEVYLTVLGRAGENLPKAQLLAVAARLAQPS